MIQRLHLLHRILLLLREQGSGEPVGDLRLSSIHLQSLGQFDFGLGIVLAGYLDQAQGPLRVTAPCRLWLLPSRRHPGWQAYLRERKWCPDRPKDVSRFAQPCPDRQAEASE